MSLLIPPDVINLFRPYVVDACVCKYPELFGFVFDDLWKICLVFVFGWFLGRMRFPK